MNCNCGSGIKYEDCCGKYHRGELPETALQLMRSRYCAYARNLPEYIMETTHHENRSYQTDKAAWKKSLQKFSRATLFDQLTILDFTDGEDEAYVTFKAHLRKGLQDVSFTEKSKFLKVNGRWLYC